jgi:molybdopterin/thiamine biosynthesis adenylyltransferase
MTRYTLTFLEQDFERLRGSLKAAPGVENAAYLVCRMSRAPSEVRLLVRDIIPVQPEHILEASAAHMKIASASFRSAMKRADAQKGAFAFVHTHPQGHPQHSAQDDREEAPLFRTAYARIHNDAAVHASLILSDGKISAGRVWLPDGTVQPMERVRIIGNRFQFWFAQADEEPVPEFFDRQVRAFGSALQPLLRRLHIGVLGAGGTGSAVIEQLVRLGIGSLLLSDGQNFDASNVNRVYGSRVIDQDLSKLKIAERLIADIGLGTELRLLPRPITFRSAVAEYRTCDAIFGCTDDEWGRSILTRLAIYYAIPVFDMGVKIDSKDGIIRSINGRVTTLLPGTACLYCRSRITAEGVGFESIRATDPERAQALEKEGYIPELGEPAPAVIPFTTTVAASAIQEFLHRLTGYMGPDRNSSEVLHLFDSTMVRRNSKPSRPECFCGDRTFWGRGDTRPLLDMTWRTE